MTPIYALTILLVIFAFGEIVAQQTKAVLSTTLVIAAVLLIAFWCGMPADIFQHSAVTAIGINLIGILIVSMGTMMDLPELFRQWKTVVISLVGVIAGVALIVVAGPFFIGRETSLAGASIFAGANVAALMMLKAAAEKGLQHLDTFIVLILVTQNFVGIPISSLLLKKEAEVFLKNTDALAVSSTNARSENSEKNKKNRLLQLPQQLDKPSFAIAKVALVACLSFFISKLTGGTLHYFVVALLMGVVFMELGFLERNILAKTEAAGFIIFSTTIIIFGSLAKTTPAMLLEVLFPLVCCLGIGAIGTIAAGAITGKILGVSPYLSISLGLTCTFGFPTTMLMSKEVAVAMGRTEEEKEALIAHIMPKMIIAGFTTVTIASVVIAGVIITLL